MPPVVLINAVGLTPRLLPFAPRLAAAAAWCVPLDEALPAVTCTAQATILTGQPARVHGVVANGWLYRDTGEVRFWQQSNRLVEAEPLYVTLARRAKQSGKPFRCAKLFWWFNQGAAVEVSPFGSESYGAAIVTSITDGVLARQVCIFDKQSHKAELAAPFLPDQ